MGSSPGSCKTEGCVNNPMIAEKETCPYSDFEDSDSDASCMSHDSDCEYFDGADEEADEKPLVVKDLEYWKAEAKKADKVSDILATWNAAKDNDLKNLKSSTVDKLKLADNEMRRLIESSLERAQVLANEVARNRATAKHKLRLTREAHAVSIGEGKRYRDTISDLKSEILSMEQDADKLAAYHTEFSVRKRPRF
jgi:hypothetical protein